MSTTYQTVGRFVTRPSGTGKPDIMIGAFLKNQEYIKENTVYEIIDSMGALILVEKGESWIPENGNFISWANSIDHIMINVGNNMILTKKENK